MEWITRNKRKIKEIKSTIDTNAAQQNEINKQIKAIDKEIKTIEGEEEEKEKLTKEIEKRIADLTQRLKDKKLAQRHKSKLNSEISSLETEKEKLKKEPEILTLEKVEKEIKELEKQIIKCGNNIKKIKNQKKINEETAIQKMFQNAIEVLKITKEIIEIEQSQVNDKKTEIQEKIQQKNKIINRYPGFIYDFKNMKTKTEQENETKAREKENEEKLTPLKEKREKLKETSKVLKIFQEAEIKKREDKKEEDLQTKRENLKKDTTINNNDNKAGTYVEGYTARFGKIFTTPKYSLNATRQKQKQKQ